MNGAASLRRRHIVDRVMRGLIWLSAGIAVLLLLLVVAYVARQGIPAINLALFTRDPAPVGRPGGGIRPSLVGSAEMVGLGTLIGVPIALGAAIYVREYAGPRGAVVVRFLIDVLAGVPTIIVGLFIYGLLVVPMGTFSALAGSVALAIILMPIVARVADEMLGVVPNSMREAAYALGVPRWKTIVRIVLPSAAGGIVTGIVLSVARIAGEAAPLIFTALGNTVTSTSLTKPIDALPLRIWIYASGPYTVWHNQAWAASLVLVGMVLIFALVLRVIVQRSS